MKTLSRMSEWMTNKTALVTFIFSIEMNLIDTTQTMDLK